ncbi:MAG TPA: GPW/gp25 family protein [Dehalococcoidia bacterium]|nr:GPW/gp25 family protein [Dehalococcoidia bacterium]
MTSARDKGWRYLIPDLDAPEGEAGVQLSLTRGISMLEGSRAVRQALLLLISTIPGERVMRPDYGCNLHWLVFSPNDDTTAGMAIHYIRSAIEKWEPRVEIISLDASRNPERTEVMDILLEYRIRATVTDHQLNFSLNLVGE